MINPDCFCCAHELWLSNEKQRCKAQSMYENPEMQMVFAAPGCEKANMFSFRSMSGAREVSLHLWKKPWLCSSTVWLWGWRVPCCRRSTSCWMQPINCEGSAFAQQHLPTSLFLHHLVLKSCTRATGHKCKEMTGREQLIALVVLSVIEVLCLPNHEYKHSFTVTSGIQKVFQRLCWRQLSVQKG